MGENAAVRNYRLSCAIAMMVTCLVTKSSFAQTGTLAEPFPVPDANAALHYQRALLHLAEMDDYRKSPLNKPIWEGLPELKEKQLSREISSLLSQARYAMKDAASGSRLDRCNFGIDFSELGAGTPLPHVEGMVHLGRLLTLRGTYAEVGENWEEAAIIYFDGLRMGRHLTHQNTLVEVLAGIEILRNNYFALARWGTRCPSRPLVARAFGLFESLQSSLVNPSVVLSRETSILMLDFDRLSDEYPDGNWEEMILESVGEPVTGKKDADRQTAFELCVKRGIPEDTFESASNFQRYIEKLKSTGHRFAESVTACMTLPPSARVTRARALRNKYSSLMKLLANETLIDPVELSVLLSEHESELAVTRLALAVCSSKKDDLYPDALSALESRFGGKVPVNPYTSEPIPYEVLDDGRSFRLHIEATADFPAVSFNSSSPAPVE